MILNIFNKTRKRIQIKFCQKVANTVSREIGKRAKASLVFVSEGEIGQLNKKYRKKNKVTNVLSFSFLDKDEKRFDSEKDYLGEVFVCLKYAEQEAEKYNWSLERNLTRLITHGLLHLYGFDHETLAERKKMENLENKIMHKLKYD